MHADAHPVHLITGLILAGGCAHRMQNLDKGLQRLDGMRLVDHVIGRLAPQVTTLIINTNRHQAEYAQCGYSVYSDAHYFARSDATAKLGFEGPLAGLEVGLTHCKTPFLLVVPCDSPFLPLDLASRLLAALLQEKADIAIACTGEQTHPRAQPCFCLLKASLLTPLQHYLAGGGRKMDGWYGQLSVARVYFDDERAFLNINTLEELKACSKDPHLC